MMKLVGSGEGNIALPKRKRQTPTEAKEKTGLPEKGSPGGNYGLST